jgi:DNA replication protein DnaC
MLRLGEPGWFEAKIAEFAAAEGCTVEEWHARRDAEEKRREEERRRDEERQRRAAEAQKRRDWIAQYEPLVGAEMAEAVYDRQEGPSEATKLVGSWLGGDLPCLVLSGGVGAGKTVAALIALREHEGLWIPRQTGRRFWNGSYEQWRPACPCPIVRASKLAAAVDPWKHERDEGAEPIALDRKFLCIDDLGAEFDEPRFHQALFSAIDARQSPKTRTLITTNLRREEIRPRYGDRIADRLNAMAKVVQLKSASMRKQGAGL